MAEKLEIDVVANDKASGVLGGIKGALGGIGGFAKGALIAGVGAAIGGVVALGAGLVSCAQDAIEAEEGQAQLAAVLKSTGGAAGVTADMANNLASALQSTTRFSDDAVLAGENMMLTFTSIGKDVFPEATSTMLDMSQALGQDVKASAMQLGKALNDPIQGVSVLRRVGVQLTDAQEKQVQAMVKAGDVAGAQKVILSELKREFGGAAEAAGGTFAGKLDILRNKFGDIKESIGGVVLGALTPLASMIADTIAPTIASFVESSLPKLESFLYSIGGFITDVVGKLASGDIAGALKSLIPPELLALIQPVVDAVQNLFVAFQSQAPAAQAQGAAFMAWLQPMLGTVLPQIMQNVALAIQTVAQLWQQHGAAIMAGVMTVIQVVISVVMGAVNLITGIVTAFIQLLTGNWSGAWNTIKSTVSNVFGGVVSWLGERFQEIVSSAKTKLETFKSNITTTFNTVVSTIKAKIAEFTTMGKNLIQGLIDGAKQSAQGLIEAITGVVGDAIAAAKKLLGIKSPSRVFATIGVQMMQGWQQGIEQGGAAPLRATASVAQRTIAAAASVTAGAGAGGITLVYAPAFSTADADELELRLMPLIESSWRKLQGRA